MNRYVCYGYRIANGEYAADHAEAQIIQRIFSAYLKGISFLEIARDLNDKGIYYNREGGHWNKNNVSRVLANRRYVGENGYPVIVDTAAFEQAQVIRSQRTRCARKTTDEALWKRFVCGECGHALKRYGGDNNKEIRTYFRCERCGARIALPSSELIDLVIDAINNKSVTNDETQKYVQSVHAMRAWNEADRWLEASSADRREVLQRIFQAASVEYDGIPHSKAYLEAPRMLKYINARLPLRQMDHGFIKKAVSQIILNKDRTIQVRFFNI